MTKRLFVVLVVLALVAASCGSDDAEQSAPASTPQPDRAVADPTATPLTPTATPIVEAPEPTAPPVPDTRRPIVIDTDMSIEGAMAILYLLQHPDVRVDAITVAGTGLVSCRKGVEQALGLVALAEARDIPVACGPATPLSGDNAFPGSFRTVAGSLSGVLLPRGGPPSELAAPDLLASVIAASDGDVAVYADGPLTNLALLLERAPEVVDNISGITMMGGALDVAGNTFENPDAEWNIWVDPVAADRVVRSGVPVTMVPLDATNAVPLTVLHLRYLEQHQATPVAETVFKLVRGAPALGQGFTYLWDQLNAVVLVDESVVDIETVPITVVTEGGSDVVGATNRDPSGTEVRVAVDADREAFEETFFSTLLGETVGPVDLSPDANASFDGTGWSHDLPEAWPRGPIVVALENTSDQSVALVIGWLLGDATLDDLAAWESLEQPPFLELAGFVSAEANGSGFGVIELTEPGMNVATGLTVDPDSVTRIALLDVT